MKTSKEDVEHKIANLTVAILDLKHEKKKQMAEFNAEIKDFEEQIKSLLRAREGVEKAE